MSEVRLNLIDPLQILQGTIHGSVVDACVAALSAEPETIAELDAALARTIKPTGDAALRLIKISHGWEEEMTLRIYCILKTFSRWYLKIKKMFVDVLRRRISDLLGPRLNKLLI
jgi:hypothetical protein